MGVYRVDGSGGLTPSAYSAQPTSQTSQSGQTFAQALQDAQTATDKAISSNDQKDWAVADQDWAIVESFVANDYRVAATSSDPKSATAALDTQYANTFRGQGKETDLFDKIVSDAKSQVQKESPAEQQYQVSLFKAQQKVSDTYTALQSATGSDQSTALTNYTNALTDLVNLELNHELSGMPAGPNGSHTLDQWMAAAKKVEQASGVTGDSAQIIESIAKVSGYQDVILHNPGSLNLTPAEQALAKSDPTTLAFLKAAGITLNSNDPALKNLPLMQQIESKDPVLFALLSKSGAKIWTDSTPVKNGTSVGLLNNGQYLHVTINDKPIDEQELNKFVQLWGQTYGDNRPLAVGAALLPDLNLGNNTELQSLMIASDNARMQYATPYMKTLMSGANPDAKAAISFLNTELNGFFDANNRAAFWNSSGKPYFTVDYFKHQFQLLMQKPNPNDPNYYKESQDTEINADKVGQYMQDILKNAPKEVADVLLDAVKSDFGNKWYQSNQAPGGLGIAPARFKEFYKGLSMAVELDPSRADEFANWLTDRKGSQAGILTELWDPQTYNFEGIKDTISGGYGPTLSTHLKAIIDKNSNFQNMSFMFDVRYKQGYDKVQGDITNKINNQDYSDFMKDPSKALTPFFQSFLNGGKVGHELTYQNDTQWRDIIGQTLGLTPNAPGGQQAEDANNYNVDWYQQGTPQWNAIMLVENWLHDQGADKPGAKVTALPFKYVSKAAGLQNGGLFLIDKPGAKDDNPKDQEVIDGTAALDAINMNGGQMVDPNNVNFQWHYDNLNNFQDDNKYDEHGYIYLPTNLQLTGHNGKILPSDYTQYAAHIKTAGEWAMQIAMPALAVTGAVLMFVPGPGWLVGGALLTVGAAGAGISVYQIVNMHSHGESISPSNPEAMGQYMNIAGNMLAWARLGGLLWAGSKAGLGWSIMRGASSLAGTTSTYIGVSQTVSGTQSFVQTLNDPNASVWDKVLSGAGVASGLAMIGESGMKVRPTSFDNVVDDYGSPRVASVRQTGSRAFGFWEGDGSPVTGGSIAELWTNAKTAFQNKIGKPAYDAWVAAGRPAESWWNDAVNSIKNDPRWNSQIQTEAQTIAGSNPVTPADEYAAIENLGLQDEVGRDAFNRWKASNSPKGSVTYKLWSQAQKLFDTQTSWKAYQRWRAEQGFVKQIGDTYKAYKASVKAGNPVDPWWTDAINAFQPQIDAKAQELAGPGNTPTPDHIAQAEAFYGTQIGVKAYELWNDSATNYRQNNKAPITTIPKQFLWWKWTQEGPSTLTYKAWAKAGNPPRLTSSGDDVILQPATQKLLFTTQNRLTQTPTDVTIWTGAEDVFKTRIGKTDFNAWVTAGRPLGLDDTYFDQANQYYKELIGSKAYEYYQNPSSMPGKAPLWLKNWAASRLWGNGVVAHWTTAGGDLGTAQSAWTAADTKWTTTDQAAFNTDINAVGKSWLDPSVKGRTLLPYWKAALADLRSDIRAKATELWTAAGGKGSATATKWVHLAEVDLIDQISEAAYKKWQAAGSPSNVPPKVASFAADWTNADNQLGANQRIWTDAQNKWTDAQNDFNAAKGAGAYNIWEDKGNPDGWFNQGWVLAQREVVTGDSWSENAGQWLKDLGQQSWIRLRTRGGLFNDVGWRQHFRQMGQAAKFFGTLYGATNLVGALGWVTANYYSHEVRKTGQITDPQAELEALLKDPGGYMKKNYEVQIFGLTFDPETIPVIGPYVGPAFHEAGGDLMAFVGSDGNEYFHRIPEDLYNALKAQAVKDGNVIKPGISPTQFEPWLLEPQTNQYSDAQVFVQNGKLYVYQTINLSNTGPFSLSNTDPLKSDPSKLPSTIEQQIGVRAYLAWLKAGMPQGTAGASIWMQAQNSFMNQTGAPAYNAWVQAGRPATGDNSYWAQALAIFQPQISADANTLWKQAGGQGSGPTQAQKNQAEQKYGAQIAMQAFKNWLLDGSKDQNTVGLADWKKGLPAFQAAIGAPAFNAWVSAKRSIQGNNVYWQDAITQWTKAGKPIMQQVQLRLPYRYEGNVDGSIYGQKEGDSGFIGTGFRDRWTWGAGPIEGWRLHANMELTFNYRYNTTNATTFRIGGPSPTQGWSWDVRQQDTTLWSRFTLGGGAWEVNGEATGTQVYDLTGKSVNGYTIMNGRIYLDTGNRNRLRLDVTGQYGRFRDTGFAELGLGMDFLKWNNNTTTFNLNGYYELQYYAPDFRAQLNFKNFGSITNARGFENIPPPLGIDPALQFTINDQRLRLINLPYLSGEKR